MPLVYSADRERRLRLVLRVDAVAGALMCLLAVFVLFVDESLRTAAAVFAVAGVVVLVASGLALRAVAGRDRRAKVAASVAGALTLVIGFLFAKAILGFALIVVGLVIVVLALLRDDPELVT